MLPSFRRDLREHVGAGKSVRKQLVEKGVQLTIRETLRLPLVHLSEVPIVWRARATPTRRRSRFVTLAIRVGLVSVRTATCAGRSRCGWRHVCSPHCALATRCHASISSAQNSRQDPARQHAARRPTNATLPPHIDTRTPTAEPRRERPLGRPQGHPPGREPGSFTSRFRTLTPRNRRLGAAQNAAPCASRGSRRNSLRLLRFVDLHSALATRAPTAH